jgi:hypothetical protein
MAFFPNQGVVPKFVFFAIQRTSLFSVVRKQRGAEHFFIGEEYPVSGYFQKD